jgi:hypothetical protein
MSPLYILFAPILLQVLFYVFIFKLLVSLVKKVFDMF